MTFDISFQFQKSRGFAFLAACFLFFSFCSIGLTHVIENPALQDGRRLRMSASGLYVEVEDPATGLWTGPSYLPTGIVINGTRRTITLEDILNLEGPRIPSSSNSQKDFNVAFVTLANEEESLLDTLEMTQKLSRFKDSLAGFFKDMARGLGSLLFPEGETAPVPLGAAASLGSELVSAHSAKPPLYSHPFGDSGFTPFEPLDLNSIHPVDFGERLARLLPESYTLHALKNPLASASLSPSSPFANLLLSKEALVSRLEHVPSLSLAAVPLLSLPVKLLTNNSLRRIPGTQYLFPLVELSKVSPELFSRVPLIWSAAALRVREDELEDEELQKGYSEVFLTATEGRFSYRATTRRAK